MRVARRARTQSPPHSRRPKCLGVLRPAWDVYRVPPRRRILLPSSLELGHDARSAPTADGRGDLVSVSPGPARECAPPARMAGDLPRNGRLRYGRA